MKKGFTLVELSIVLVIIGLLIGGILVARTMIETAKVTGYVHKLQQYEISVSNFISTYKSVPGDSPAFTPAGCGVGKHMYRHSYSPNCGKPVDAYHGIEDYATFAHLSQAGMIKGTYVATSFSGDYYGNGEQNGPVFTEDSVWVSTLGYTSRKIPVAYHHFSIYPTLRSFEVYLRPTEAVALDFKMDNGKGADGKIETQEIIYSGSNCEDYISQSSTDPISFPPDTVCMLNWFPDR